MRETFVFPNLDPLLENHGEDSTDKIVVVSIIGKSDYSASGLKLKSLGRMFTSKAKRNGECTIEGYFDEENQIIYLHVHSLLDTDNFIKHFEDVTEQAKEKQVSDDFLSTYELVKNSFAKALFTVFYTSHIVILSHPSHTFDMDYIQYFKSMELLDKKLLEKITVALKDVGGISEEWATAGRPATPRIIFFFERCPKLVKNVKKFEHNIEDRVYQILRKTRIIGSSSRSWSLFAIPMNEEFVFVSPEPPVDRLGQAVRGLIRGCQPGGAVTVQAPFCAQSDNPRNFQTFLRQHIKQAKNKGFDDVQAHFELPTLPQWVRASRSVYDTIHSLELIPELCTETKFSEERCKKCLPLTVVKYQEGMPSRYTSTLHETKLSIALNHFSNQARGPWFQKYSEQLVEECIGFWQAGRQLCEAPSLTGNPCTLRKDHPDDQEHSSGVKYVAVCDCGRKQGSRDDPYNAKEANHTFYHNLSKECGCAKNERITFPSSKPSTTITLEPPEQNPSTTMLTTVSPAGYLPEYSSWALVCLGASSLYSHNLGLLESYHPGFWATTNYLLPWDVNVYVKAMHPVTLEEQLDPNKWPIKRREVKPTKWVPQFSVKLFIGFEYECPRGHRFMLAAPDKILKAAPGSIVKDKGQKVAESDMPLYFACLCNRGNKAMMGQLMRIHVVTPKAPVHVKINPRVQPAQGAPIFVPTLDGPSTLTQAAYWVLRLPYVYFSEKKNYFENQGGRLMSGLFSVKKIDMGGH